jgi:cytoskeletal protein CcmA (bactofilin family)
MRGLRKRWLWACVALFAFTGAVSAREFIQNTTCVIPAERTIIGTLFVLCQDLTIDGTIDGNVIGLALDAVVNGRVSGDVYLGGGTLTINGSVGQSLHYMGIELTHNAPEDTTLPTIGQNIIAGTLSTTVPQNVRIGGSVITFSYQWLMDGVIGHELNFWGSRLEIGGNIRGDVYASVGDPSSDSSRIRTVLLPFGFDVDLDNPGLVILPSANLNQVLNYNGFREGEIEGTVRGEILFTPFATPVPTLDQPSSILVFARQVFHEFTSLLVVGLLGWILFPNFWQPPLLTLRFRTIPSFSAGLLAFILSFPVVFIAIFLSVTLLLLLVVLNLEGVAIALLIALGILNIIGIGGFYFFAIYVGRVIVAWALGRFLLGGARQNLSQRQFALSSLLVGLLGLSVLISLPSVGWVVNALALFCGLGTLILVLVQQLQRVRQTPIVPNPVVPTTMLVSVPLTPPLINIPSVLEHTLPTPTPTSPAREIGLGMDNLPQGFDPDKFFKE